ncbi:unnamed protein product [Moneuplotes crassus]|uniref:Uncharacterized protein n=1 Tax=Euplotes crassus TaxID=5936 RepID=A0AAD2CVG6_EUPCR|nr:unnamed protein product [Moneuplotes crassus]
MSYISPCQGFYPEHLKRLKSFRTKRNMDITDIEGSKPNYWVARFQKRDHMRTDDIDGATAPRIPKYTGRRTRESYTRLTNTKMLNSRVKLNDIWHDNSLKNNDSYATLPANDSPHKGESYSPARSREGSGDRFESPTNLQMEEKKKRIVVPRQSILETPPGNSLDIRPKIPRLYKIRSEKRLSGIGNQSFDHSLESFPTGHPQKIHNTTIKLQDGKIRENAKNILSKSFESIPDEMLQSRNKGTLDLKRNLLSNNYRTENANDPYSGQVLEGSDYGYEVPRFNKPPPVHQNTKIYNTNPWTDHKTSPVQIRMNRYSRDLKRARNGPKWNLPSINNRGAHKLNFKNQEHKVLRESLHGSPS